VRWPQELELAWGLSGITQAESPDRLVGPTTLRDREAEALTPDKPPERGDVPCGGGPGADTVRHGERIGAAATYQQRMAEVSPAATLMTGRPASPSALTLRDTMDSAPPFLRVGNRVILTARRGTESQRDRQRSQPGRHHHAIAFFDLLDGDEGHVEQLAVEPAEKEEVVATPRA